MDWALLWLPVAMVAGRVLHELTHAAVAVAVGAQIETLTASVVEYRLPADAPAWKDGVIGVAPVLTGVAVGVAALTLGPPTGGLGVALAAGWAVYTFWGDPATDLRVRAAHPDR